MIFRQSIIPCVGGALLALVACSTPTGNLPVSEKLAECHVVYDAGSSGTRLYIYRRSPAGWVAHDGPKTAPLADPVRRLRGKDPEDIDALITETLAALENIRSPGPDTGDGAPLWAAFDWRSRCDTDLLEVSVLATAGMRLAEIEDPQRSAALWEKLNLRLSGLVGRAVVTRTLSPYEEGLFAWLAIREGRGDGAFGVAAMGGASLQVTFPCRACPSSRPVKAGNASVPVFSHSFLGWGQDEAWRKLAASGDCARGAGLSNPQWAAADCEVSMGGFSEAAAAVRELIAANTQTEWFLGEAFLYSTAEDIERFCRRGEDSGYQPGSACFRAVYLKYVLDRLGIPENSARVETGWTLGAVVCTATRCLDDADADPSVFFRHVHGAADVARADSAAAVPEHAEIPADIRDADPAR